MFVYPEINPIAFSLGPIKVHWYGLMYLLSFLLGWGLGVLRTRLAHVRWQREEVGDYLFYVVLGVVVGGRVGYMLFYQSQVLFSQPLQLLYVWQGGMSFHGGLIGVALASWWYAHRTQRHFFDIADFVAPLAPIGLFFGRIGNFINGELVGRVTDVPWAALYPQSVLLRGQHFLQGGPYPRHPSELYEAFFEGIVLFALLLWFSARPRPRMAVSGLFLLGYGCFRFCLEFFRQPDAFLGFVAFGWMTMGQVLCIPMIIIGVLMLAWAYSHNSEQQAA